MKTFNPILEIYGNTIFINYWQVYSDYDNPYFNKRFHSLEWKFIRIGFDKKLFGIEEYIYDGFILKEIILFGLSLGYGSNCIAKPTTENLFD